VLNIVPLGGVVSEIAAAITDLGLERSVSGASLGSASPAVAGAAADPRGALSR
jgi:hypothetical protein